MPHPDLPALESRLHALLLEFDRLQDAWSKGMNAVERAELGRRCEGLLRANQALNEEIAAIPARP